MKKSIVRMMAVALAIPLLSWLLLASTQDSPGKKTNEPTAKKGAGE